MRGEQKSGSGEEVSWRDLGGSKDDKAAADKAGVRHDQAGSLVTSVCLLDLAPGWMTDQPKVPNRVRRWVGAVMLVEDRVRRCAPAVKA